MAENKQSLSVHQSEVQPMENVSIFDMKVRKDND